MRTNKKIQHVICVEEQDTNFNGDVSSGYFALGFEALGLKVKSLNINKYKRAQEHKELAEVIKRIQNVEPVDLIFFNHHSDFDFKTKLFNEVKRLNIKTSIWLGDDNHKFYSETRHIAGLFDYPITTCNFATERYEAEGIQLPILSYWGAEMQMVNPQEHLDTNTKPKYGVTFVGTWSRYRQFVFERLNEHGFQPSFFGPGWPSGALTRAQCVEVFLNSKVNLSLDKIDVSTDVQYLLSDFRILIKRLMTRNKLYESINPVQTKRRPFDLAVLSVPQLIQYSSGLESLLDINNDVEVFTNSDELILKLHKWRSGNLDLVTKAKKLGLSAKFNHTISAALCSIVDQINEVTEDCR